MPKDMRSEFLAEAKPQSVLVKNTVNSRKRQLLSLGIDQNGAVILRFQPAQDLIPLGKVLPEHLLCPVCQKDKSLLVPFSCDKDAPSVEIYVLYLHVHDLAQSATGRVEKIEHCDFHQ